MNQPGSNIPLVVQRKSDRDEVLYDSEGDVAAEVEVDDTEPKERNLNKKELKK